MTTQPENLAVAEVDAPAKTARIWLVRHGQTDANLIGRYQGHLDLPLNETGREQVVTMGAQLREELETRGIATVQALYSSDLVRTRETAQAVADSIGMEIVPDARLREIHMGDWEGASFTDIREQFPAIVEQRFRDPMHIAPPNGETTFDVAKRMWPALDAYAARHQGDDPIVVVSHGMAIATVICRIRGMSLARVFEVVPGNAEVTMIEWEPTSPDWIEEQEALSQR